MSNKKLRKADANIKISQKLNVKPAIQKEHRYKNFLLIISLLIICIVTAVTFSPSLENSFINWDDNQYVTENPDIMGVNVHNLKKIFSSVYVANYQPLTMLSYMIDFQFFKLNPMAFHTTSLLWHIANSIVVFLLIYSLCGSNFASFLTAILFAIHPLRVESVAWVAERKDVMTAFFFFLSLLLYVRYLKIQNRIFYYLGIVSFIFSLLCKPMAVSLPLVLLLINYLKSGKIEKKDLLNTIPFVAISSIFVIVTLITQNVFTHASADTVSLSILNRIGIPFYGILFYVFKTIVPFNLSSFYPFPGNSELPILVIISPLIVVGIVFSFFYFKVRSRILMFGLFYYIITLLPVLQIIPVGNAMVAERYSYIPCIGLLFPIAMYADYLLKEKSNIQKNVKYVLLSALFISVFVFSSLSFVRCSVWKNSLTLWDDVVKKYPVDETFYYRGLAYSEQGDFPKAIDDYNKAIEKNPRNALALDARGIACFNVGLYDRAINDYTEAIRIVPQYATSYSNRATAYAQTGNFTSAIDDFSAALRNCSEGVFASYCYSNRGLAYSHTGDFKKAITDFSEAIKINPGYYPQVYYYRSIAYKAINDNDRAMNDLKTACNSGFDPACQMIKEVQ